MIYSKYLQTEAIYSIMISLGNIPAFVTTILMHVKLANGGLSWMDVFIPMIVQHSLILCVMQAFSYCCDCED